MNPNQRGTLPCRPEPHVSAGRGWMGRLQQIPSLMYLVAGIFLVVLYWRRLPRQSILACGVLFILYSIYRFFLVQRSLKRSEVGRGAPPSRRPPGAPTDPRR